MTMDATPMSEALTPRDYKSDIKPVWCPGCGDYSVLGSITTALAELLPARLVEFLTPELALSGNLADLSDKRIAEIARTLGLDLTVLDFPDGGLAAWSSDYQSIYLLESHEEGDLWLASRGGGG